MNSALPLPDNTKSFIAKWIVFFWIFFLTTVAVYLVFFTLRLDVNGFLGLSGEQLLGTESVHEIKLILSMISVSMFGGTIFIIKDFYRSIKNETLFNQAYEDYLGNILSFDEFQQLISVDIYTKRFHHSWIYWFLMQPILSTIVGMIAFFIARSGLGFLQGASFEANISIQTFYVYGVFTFLAGFSSHKVLSWLDSLADKVFVVPASEKISTSKAAVTSTASEEQKNLRNIVDEQKGATASTASTTSYKKVR